MKRWLNKYIQNKNYKTLIIIIIHMSVCINASVSCLYHVCSAWSCVWRRVCTSTTSETWRCYTRSGTRRPTARVCVLSPFTMTTATSPTPAAARSGRCRSSTRPILYVFFIFFVLGIWSIIGLAKLIGDWLCNWFVRWGSCSWCS